VSFSKIKTFLAFVGFCTLLYLCGTWAIDIINDILTWFKSTGVTQ
jgi:hypothetical protein